MLVREVSKEFGLPYTRMSLDGKVYKHRTELADENCATMRIPLGGVGYVNFRYPAAASVRHAVAITSMRRQHPSNQCRRSRDHSSQARTCGAGGPRPTCLPKKAL